MTCGSTLIYNSTGLIGIALCGITENVTGSLFLSLMSIVIFMVVVMLLFRIPLEFQAFLILPFLLVLMAFTQEFLTIGGVALIFIAAVVAKAWSNF